MTASVPFSAPGRPPLTGESTATIFFRASPSAIRRAAVAPVVDVSMKIFTRLPSAIPRGPSATVSTTGGVGRLTKTISHADATAAGESRACAPRSTRGRMISALVSKIVRSRPASSRRRAMRPPILPTPTKPILSVATLHAHFLEDFFCDSEAIDAGRDAAIDGNGEEYLL